MESCPQSYASCYVARYARIFGPSSLLEKCADVLLVDVLILRPQPIASQLFLGQDGWLVEWRCVVDCNEGSASTAGCRRTHVWNDVSCCLAWLKPAGGGEILAHPSGCAVFTPTHPCELRTHVCSLCVVVCAEGLRPQHT